MVDQNQKMFLPTTSEVALGWFLVAESGVQIGVILTFTALAFFRLKQTDQVPVLFMTTAIFLLLANLSVFIRSLTSFFSPTLSFPGTPLYTSLIFFQYFFLNGAYYMFARRYSLLSFELQELQKKT
jgi:hypothetical protein